MALWQRQIAGLGGRFYAAPHLLLSLAALFFGGNTVAGQLAVEHISPYQLVLLRWFVVSAVIGLLLRRRIPPAWQLAKHRLGWMFGMGLLGFTFFNTLFYMAAYQTSAANMGIIQGAIPVWVLLGAFVAYRTPVRGVQLAGVLLTVGGVVVLTSRGEWAALLSPAIANSGDVMMLVAGFGYACYTVGLKNRPSIGGLEFFWMLSLAAMCSALPLAIYEVAAGGAQWPTRQGWLVLLYVAIFPSCLSQIFFMRGVELLGPGRAGVFLNLVPVFSAVLAVLVINEPLLWFQVAALILVVAGIGLSEKSVRQK